jgi:hypothetical protein
LASTNPIGTVSPGKARCEDGSTLSVILFTDWRLQVNAVTANRKMKTHVTSRNGTGTAAPTTARIATTTRKP